MARFSHFFIDRPIFASVISVLIVIAGALAYSQLPVAPYPEVAPPTVVVSTAYPGATPDTIAETVATPLEQEINGVEGMIYMESSSSSDGAMQLTVTFDLGTDLDIAQVQTQNRVASALPRLPDTVRQIGVTTQKQSPDLLMVVHMISPKDTPEANKRDQLYISNFAYTQVREQLRRLEGVGNVQVFGGREYAMRVWLDIDRLPMFDLTAGDVVRALQEQNTQVAAGVLGQQPVDNGEAFQIPVTTQGRLKTVEQFEDVVVKQAGQRNGITSGVVKLKDVARVELGARDYAVNSYLDDQEAVALVISQRPGSNALSTADAVIEEMKRIKETSFEPGLDYRIVYNPTQFVSQSIDEVFVTLYQAAALVVLTVFLFLQDWRKSLIPAIAIPVSLVGTFAVLLVLGFSLNNLSLFGLVLAIGIVVDDAIVVVETVDRLINEGKSPKEATRAAMLEVGGALVATSLVLVAVFVPTAFLSGITGQFYRQFAVTISIATVLSTLVSLTLSPAMCGLLLKSSDAKKNWFGKLIDKLLGWFFTLFNKTFEKVESVYSWIVCRAVRMAVVCLAIYVGLLALTGYVFTKTPTGFIPAQDQGYLIVAITLPPGASLSRTDKVVQQVRKLALEIDGISNAVAFAGFSGATRVNSSAAAAVFTPLESFDKRVESGRDVETILGELRQKVGGIRDAMVLVLQPPPVRGIGTGGGFKMQLQDRGGVGLDNLIAAAGDLTGKMRQKQGMVQPFSLMTNNTPQLRADIDREKAEMLDVPVGNIFETMQVFLGSIYINDFNLLGRTYRVTAQADQQFRDDPADIGRLRTRSTNGASVPLGTLVTVDRTIGPERVVRYNLYPAADINGDTTPDYSSGQALADMEEFAESLPAGISYEWTDLAYQQKAAGNAILYIFPLCVLFVFLTLAAQYESLLLPLAVILIVPMCILCALIGIGVRGMPNDILVQIGLVVLVGLACKNAILIVEFAKQQEDEGKDRINAAVDAATLRLRPVLMTAVSFILGVLPLVFATGPGSEMRQALGTAVFGGMIGVTAFGLLLTPVFYAVLRKFSPDGREPDAADDSNESTPDAESDSKMASGKLQPA